MKQLRFSLALAVALALLGTGLMLAVRPAVAQQSPDAVTVDSAVLSIYVSTPSEQTVNVHRVTAMWTEQGVTWDNFGNSFATTLMGSFPASAGWHTMTITSRVQTWVNNPLQNFGLLLEQGQSLTEYNSSDYVTSTLRPKLDVWYKRSDGSTNHVTFQRGVGSKNTVADAYVWESYPGSNYGNSVTLFSGLHPVLSSVPDSVSCVGTKYSLLRFDLTTTPNAVTVQSLSARSSVAPDLALAAVGVVSIAGVVVLRRRRLL